MASVDRLRSAPLRDPHDVARSHRPRRAANDALQIVDDDLGYPWLTWRGRKLGARRRAAAGGDLRARDVARTDPRRAPAGASLRRRATPRLLGRGRARADRLVAMGVDEAVVFPNFGLLWERTLDADLGALTANMTAWNRWCAAVATDGRGRVHPVAHVTLRDESWLLAELARPGAGRRASGDGGARARRRSAALASRPRAASGARSSSTACGRVFHVADQRRPFADAWYTDPPDAFISTLDSVFLWTAAALACTDLILNGTLERHPDLRIGIVELERGVGADVPDDARRRIGVHRPAQRASARAARAAARASTSGARCASRRSPTSCRRG